MTLTHFFLTSMRRATAAVLRGASRAQRSTSSQATQNNLKVTTLPNKIRVATQGPRGHFSSVGLYIDAGARYENEHTSGVSHFIDRLAFKSTTTRSDDEIANDIHSLGGQIMCSSNRDIIMYQSSHAHKGTPLALSLIADTVINPAFKPEDIEAQREAAAYEIRELGSKPEMILPEILHNVAYGNQGLGNPVLCPEDRISTINESLLRSSMEIMFLPERMVVAGSGMPHEELVELAEKHFSSIKPSLHSSSLPTQSPSLPRLNPLTSQVSPHLLKPPSQGVAKTLTRAASYLFPNSHSANLSGAIPKSPTSTYTGGHRFIYDTEQELGHLYVGFEGVGILDDDIYPLATMQILLGGGGSFSAGGPGKGMYSRLYTNILNHYNQIDHCASFHHIYNDSSLMGLFASFVDTGSSGSTPDQILPHLVHQLSLLLYSSVPAAELQRAKNQLNSSLMMAMESRMIEVEDLGRQFIVNNRKIDVSEMTEKIDAITPMDVKRVAARVFSPHSGSRATVVTMGRRDVSVSWPDTFAKYGLAS